MRILHAGWGFSPWRGGGLIRYAEDVMALQARRGHEVHYLCSGRHYPRTGGLRLKRWRRDGVRVHELINPPILAGVDLGTRRPDLELEEPGIERVFARLLDELRPDVMHVQELMGLPSSIIDIARDAGVPVVMTLQDYFPLCPTVRLFDADGELCLERGIRPACAAACRHAPADAGGLVSRTLRFELSRAKEAVPGLRRRRLDALGPLVHRALARRIGAEPPPAEPAAPVTPEQLRRRREVNAARLSRVDRLLAMSHRVEEIYRLLGVDGERLRTLHLTLGHLERLSPRPPRRSAPPLTFGAIDTFATASKGAELLIEAVRLVRERGGAGRFRVKVFGFLFGAYIERVRGWDEVELHGVFDPDEVDHVLDGIDVGLLAPVWEEAYGYVGLEFLAKGIPLLASARGGIVDYAREGETAWLNRSVTAEELAERMLGLIDHPERVEALARSAATAGPALVKPLDRHGDELDAIYGEVVAAGTTAGAAAAAAA